MVLQPRILPQLNGKDLYARLTVFLALLILSSTVLLRARAAHLDLGSRVSRTPFEPYAAPVKKVLRTLDRQATMDEVAALVEEGWDFDYAWRHPYAVAEPAVTERSHEGDCKAMALWLCARMGDRHARFVLGKYRADSYLSHAWVLWPHGGRWWILDPTKSAFPIPAASVLRDEYVPLYSYSRQGAFLHRGDSAGERKVRDSRTTGRTKSLR